MSLYYDLFVARSRPTMANNNFFQIEFAHLLVLAGNFFIIRPLVLAGNFSQIKFAQHNEQWTDLTYEDRRRRRAEKWSNESMALKCLRLTWSHYSCCGSWNGRPIRWLMMMADADADGVRQHQLSFPRRFHLRLRSILHNTQQVVVLVPQFC